MSNYSDSSFDDTNANTSWYKVYHLIPNGSKVLDIGCSSGNFGAELIKRKQCTVDGIELDHSDYVKAKKKLRKVYQLNIETDSLDGLEDKYDIIYFGDVIEHLVSPSDALKRIKSLLKPNGKILFSIPNMTHIAVRLLLLKGDFEYTETGLLDKTHLHFYGLDEVYRTFQEAGYDVDHIDFVEKDYPKSLIKKWLQGIGLTANDKFYQQMKKPDASAFQFVGTASTAKHVVALRRKQFGPIDLFETYHNNIVDGLKSRIKNLENENLHLKEIEEKWVLLKNHPVKFATSRLKGKRTK